MSNPLVCKACRKSAMTFIEPEKDGRDFDRDMRCDGCGHIFHGMQDWDDYGKPRFGELRKWDIFSFQGDTWIKIDGSKAIAIEIWRNEAGLGQIKDFSQVSEVVTLYGTKRGRNGTNLCDN